MEERILVTRSSMPSYEEYCEAIKPLWDTHWITNMGQYHKTLEQQLREYLDVPMVSLTVNGHMALEMTIQAFDFPEGSEVITTPFTFISTTHAIVRNRLKPVFCDIKETDGTIDESKIESLITDRTVAILPVHVYGHICNVEEIQRIADRHGLKVIYDAAHAFGERYKGEGVANLGDVSIFSFHATKVYNTIEGGAVTSKNEELYAALYDLKNFGIHGEEHVTAIGANAKMNEFAAIMGILNLKHIDEAIRDRKRVFERYYERLKDVKGIRHFDRDDDTQTNYAYYPIIVEDEYSISRDDLYKLLRENDIYSRKYFYPLTCDQECFRGIYAKSDIPVAREMAKKALVLPIYEGMEDSTVDRIVDIITG